MVNQVLQSPTNPHFFQPLLPGFHSHLSIPLKFFSKYIQGRNKKNMVELTSDACEKTWNVKLEGRRLTVGWKDFADAHYFRIGDIVVFRHEGDFLFHVTALGPSCCQIQYVHSRDYDQEEEEKKHVKKNRIHKVEAVESDQSCFVANVTDSNLREDTLFLPKRFVWSDVLSKGKEKIGLMDERARTWTLNLRFRKSSGTFYMTHGWRSFCHENVLKPGDSVTFKRESNNANTPLLRFSTSDQSKCVFAKHSRAEKKRKTGESSQSRVSSTTLSEKRFVTLTVTPSSLKDCRLHLPVSFMRFHKMEKAGGKEITMLDQHGVE